MDGLYYQLENLPEAEGEATEDDFISVMNDLAKREESNKPFIFLTNLGGYLTYMFNILGRQKLPRKMKKRIFMTKELRKLYIPQYYVNNKR